ncbi:MAG: Nucleotidyltransferase substrate binding protein [Candidatus Midichloriaceae bacterium]|jgi:nucleotidyltransferase substrate binding protein (TIGR01987 family)|nr:Nucleotidyltransferase substrate binding protein [Candidatus Midichloriaceae bacterium]
MQKSLIKLDKFKKALISLEAIYDKPMQEDRSNIDATIQRFEFTFELFWKSLKDLFYEQGIELNYPKEVIKQAYANKLLDDESIWLQMLKDRNLTSHTYDEVLADEIFKNIKLYTPLFRKALLQIEKLHCNA